MTTRPRLLIVEDEPDTLLLLRLNLEAAGFETALAADGPTALRRIDEVDPHVVVLDLMLPGKDGWSILAELAGRAHRPAVVVCSAKRAPRDRARAADLGASAFVPKPFKIEELVGTVHAALGHEPSQALGRAQP